MKQVFLSLGSNLGNRLQFLELATKKIEALPKLVLRKKSSYYETDPVGYTEQNQFINQVIEIETELDPCTLLNYCLAIEKELGRIRLERWGPRTIDIDMLLYEGFSSTDERLMIPHPRMTERAFVLVPLNEIAPNILIFDLTCNEWLKKVGQLNIK